jgi:hypothetical protein
VRVSLKAGFSSGILSTYTRERGTIMKIRTIVGLAMVFAAVLMLGGCIFIFNSDPVVTLTSSLTGNSCYWGEDVYYYANATDEDGDTLNYTWYLDGVEQPGVADYSTIVFIPQTNDLFTIQVVVSDNYGGDDSASMDLTSVVGSYLNIDNNHTTQAVTGVFIRHGTETSWDWDANHISVPIPANTGNVTLGVPVGILDLRAESSATFWAYNDINFPAGSTGYLEILNGGSNLTFSIFPAGSASVSTADSVRIGSIIRGVKK